MAKDPCKPTYKPPIPLIAPTLPPSEVERVKVASPPATALTAPAGVIQDLLPTTQQAASPKEIAAAARTVEAAAASLATAAGGKATGVAIAATSVEKAAAALGATTEAVKQQLRLLSPVISQPLSQPARAIPPLSQPSPATLPLSQMSLAQSGIAAMAVASPDTPPMCIETTCSEKPYTNSRDMSVTRAGIPSQPKTHTLFKYETPDHWEVQHKFEDEVKLVELDLHHGEGQKIACLFEKSGRTVVGIQRIQNLMLWNKYCTKREEIRSMLGRMTKKEERTLFHGTIPENVEAILHLGFDWRLSGENVGVKFGQGSYFARDASYAWNYGGPDQLGIEYMFVATVVVGDYVEGKSDYRRPPSKLPGIERPVRPCDYYCSCVNKRQNPTVFVVFDTAQAYPQYVISYI